MTDSVFYNIIPLLLYLLCKGNHNTIEVRTEGTWPIKDLPAPHYYKWRNADRYKWFAHWHRASYQQSWFQDPDWYQLSDMPDPSTHRKLLLWVGPDSRAFIMMWAGTPPRRRRARDCLQTSCLIALRTAHHPTPASCPLQDRSYLGCRVLSSHTENPVSPDGGRPSSGEMGVSV